MACDIIANNHPIKTHISCLMHYTVVHIYSLTFIRISFLCKLLVAICYVATLRAVHFIYVAQRAHHKVGARQQHYLTISNAAYDADRCVVLVHRSVGVQRLIVVNCVDLSKVGLVYGQATILAVGYRGQKLPN